MGIYPPAFASRPAKPISQAPALIKDLKQRGMLDETLVVWGGEFGRTCYSQGTLTKDNYGRDHHPRCFTIWMAGGGVKPGLTYGRTDDYCLQHRRRKWQPAANRQEPISCLEPYTCTTCRRPSYTCWAFDHERLTYLYQGRRFR